MKKLFLSVIAMMCCGLAWSQTTWDGSGTETDPYLIQDTNDFKKIDNGISGNFYAGKYFKQTADLNFGNMGTKEQSFIRIFAGNYDGNGKSISYNGTFAGQRHGTADNQPDQHYNNDGHGDYGLFGRVTNGGTIKNLNVNAQIVFTAKEGAANANMNAGLLCGHLDNGTISYCNVTGEVASQINASNGGGGDVGLLCGQSEGREKYCTGAGTVTGHGWVGGLIGAQHKGSIYACSFEGSVTAVTPAGNSCNDGQVNDGYGSFAGGIVGVTGYTRNQQGQTVHVDVSFCVVKANVSAGCVASGVASLAVGGGTATVTNCIGSGTVNGSKMTAEVTNSTNADNDNNYTTNGKTEEEIRQIIDSLNNAATGGLEFGNSNGNIIIYPEGKPEEPCAVPTNLVITKTGSGVSASWEGSASEYETRLTGGDLTGEQTSTVTNASWSKTSLPASPNEYVFSVRAKCPDKTKEENKQSDWVSSSFTIACPEVSSLQMQEKTSNSLTIKWETTTNDLKLTLKKGETEIRSIRTGLSSPYKITDLDANTAYTISLSAKCGENYVNPQQITLTTNKPSVPQNLKAEPYHDGTQHKGKVTIQWDAVAEAGEYEYELSDSNNATIETATISETSFTKDSCDLGAYNIKVRSKQGGAYSDWSNTLSFVISNTLVPKNPKTTFTVSQSDNSKKDVNVSWEAGNTTQTQPSWTINGDTVSYNDNPSYIFHDQEPGSRLKVSIVEYIAGGNSDALTFHIDVPCLDMAAPSLSNIKQTSATITGLESGDKIYLGGSEPATATTSSYSFSDLLPGTHYDVEVRRYCNATNGIYSAQNVAFTTYACSKPKNLSSSNISTTSATIRWDRGNADLEDLTFELKLFKDGETTAVKTISDINETTYTFNTLLPGTSYKVSIAEKCQDGYGDPVNHTFTTKAGEFVAVNTGQWSSPSTWKNGQIPTGNEANITINPDVNVTLGSGILKLTDTYTLTNNGTLTLTSSSQIINLSGNNNLGKVSLPKATVGEQNKWSLIGAPFASSYKLEAIEPVPNSDVAVVLYNYGQGKWSTDWATVTDSVQQGEAFFAWPFYSGNITFSTKLESSTETGYLLNNGDVTVSKNIVSSENGNWLPLANPYPAVLSAKKFTAGINDLQVQGKGVYLYNTNTGMFEQKTLASTDPDVEIGLCTGFFINFSSAGDKSVTFKKEHLRDWPTTTAKSCCKNGSREVVEIDLEHNYINVPLYFVHNLEAEQGYDIWDANKLFSTSGIPEPYFVTEGVNLVKEEVNELPYYATVNIRSEKDTVVTLIAKTIPEGYAVSLIDGEQETDLNEGGRYPIEITTGENADRFKLLVRKNVGLEEVANTDIKISNNNRHITITAQDKVKVSVYNALGQKVYETAKSIFTLEGVAAGAYVIKVQSGNAVQSQKVIIR